MHTDPWLLCLNGLMYLHGKSADGDEVRDTRRSPFRAVFCLRAGSRKGNRGGRGATTDGGRRDDARRVQIPPRGRAAPGFLWANLENYRPG